VKFFNRFFKDSKKLFLNFDPNGSYWSVIGWNYDLIRPGDKRWYLEINKDHAEAIEWTNDEVEKVNFLKNHRSIYKDSVSASRDQLKELMNLCIHSTLKNALTSNHEFMLSPVSGATAMDFQNEARSLQWLQASFGTVSRALEQFKERNDLILTAAVFSGKEPETGENVLRLLIFNLDVFFYFQKDFSLHIVVFDDKNQGQGAAKSPTFQQNIKVTKPQFYDEIVKLIHQIAMVGEIR
jgi:hypothetical protein